VGNRKTNGRKPKRLMRGRAVPFIAVMSVMWLKIWSWTSADRQTDRQTDRLLKSDLLDDGNSSLVLYLLDKTHKWMETVYGEVRSKYFNLTRYHYLVFDVLLTVQHLGIIFVNKQLDAQFFFMYVYFYCLHESHPNLHAKRSSIQRDIYQLSYWYN
jgi:hypothetical protein